MKVKNCSNLFKNELSKDISICEKEKIKSYIHINSQVSIEIEVKIVSIPFEIPISEIIFL